jgi:outer membrane protein OmpA-like peptidoglycan-associated protein
MRICYRPKQFKLLSVEIFGEGFMLKKLFFVVCLATLLGGCATREYVRDHVREQLRSEVDPLNTRVNSLDKRMHSAEVTLLNQGEKLNQTDATLRDVQTTVRLTADRLDKSGADLALLSKTAQSALQRAETAGKLAAGKLIYEVVLSDDKLKFPFNKSALSPDAQAVLSGFIENLKGENKNVYLEIQGHTDSIGSDAFNMRLGEARAEAVKRYLSIKGGIPLHRMATISYGESEPISNNRSQAGRQQNRRVVLVVIM